MHVVIYIATMVNQFDYTHALHSLLHVGVEELHSPSLHVAKLSPFKT